MHARIGWQNLRTSEFLDQGDYMLITGTDFDDGRINYSTCHYVEKERYDQDPHIQIGNGSILITKDGTLGKVAYVQGLEMPATLNAGVFNVEIRDEDEVDGKYLFQYLKAPFLMDYVGQKATGGTIKHLNQNILVDFPVVLPKKAEQEKIGQYFERIDNLITLHQRKCDEIKELKKYMLQNILPNKKNCNDSGGENMICPNCGAPLPDTATMCYVCKFQFKDKLPDSESNTSKLGRIQFDGSDTKSEIKEPIRQHPLAYQKQQEAARKQAYSNQSTQRFVATQTKKNGNSITLKGCFSAFIVVILVFAALVYFERGKKDDNSDSSSDSYKTSSDDTLNIQEASTKEQEPATEQYSVNISQYGVKTASDQKNMKIGDTGESDKVFIKLLHAKRSDTFMSVTGYDEDIDSENEVVFLFFDVLNASFEPKDIYDRYFTCYIDGNKVEPFQNNFYYVEDGVREYERSACPDPGTAALYLTNFEVPKNWNEMKVYFNSDCIWNATYDEVTEDSFDWNKTFISENSANDTPVGTVVYNDNYELTYDGWEYKHEKPLNMDEDYLIVKFTVHNTSDSILKYNSVGFGIRAYVDNYLVQDPDIFMDDKIDGYLNVHDVNEIQPGMSAKIYLAFQIDKKGNTYRVIYYEGEYSQKYIADIFMSDVD